MSSSCASSDSEPEQDKPTITRLGNCEVCGGKEAIYTCPKCEVKTCCLNCTRIHKKELECDGIRDRTKFIRVKDFTDTDLLSDYRMLEECARFVYGVQKDEKRKFTRVEKDLPVPLYKLKMAARQRGTVLLFLSSNFTRNKCNTSRFYSKRNIIHWRVEWVFPNVESDPLKFVDARCPENRRLSELLDKYLNPDAMPFEGSKALSFYKAAGFSGVKLLLKAEKIKGSAKKFFELDPADTLSDNLSGKCVIEFPIIFVVLKDTACNFEIITPDDEFESYNEEQKPTVKLENPKGKEPFSNDDYNPVGHTSNDDYNPVVHTSNGCSGNQWNSNRKRSWPLMTEIIAREKKKELQKEIKEERKKKPKNLLFTTGYSSEESLSDSDSDSEREDKKVDKK